MSSINSKQIMAMKTGEVIEIGPLFLGLPTATQTKLTLVEKVDGVPVFDATYCGVSLGSVAFKNSKWEWAV